MVQYGMVYQHVITAPGQLVDRGHRGCPPLLLGLAHSSIIQIAFQHMLVLPAIQLFMPPPHALPCLQRTHTVNVSDAAVLSLQNA